MMPISACLRLAAVFSLALSTLLLTACTTLHAPTSQAGMDTAARPYSDTIDISGRFSAQFEQNGRPQSWSGSFNWVQTPQATFITLLSPLDQTVATISVTHDGATLTQADKTPRTAADVDALVQETLGWPLPISNLRNWMQARARDRDGHQILATPRLINTIDTDDGWRLQYLSWQDASEPGMQNVPKRIDMERDTVQAGRVQMRLVISSWQPR